MRKLIFTALLGLATSAGAAFPAAAHADPIDLGAAITACVSTYQLGAVFDADAFNACVDNAVATAVADGTSDGASINTAILGSATDGGVNTAILGSACGDGSLNTGILGSAGC
jgi:hypothetical protein